MSDPKFKKGFVHTGTNKSSGSNDVKTLGGALKELAVCHACGCNAELGYFTQIDISTGLLQLIVIRDGTLEVYLHDAEHLTWLKAACAAREAGDDIPDPPA